MAWVIFDNFLENQEGGDAINLEAAGDDVRCMLITVTRAPVKATDETMVDIDDNEVTGTNYTAGGFDCSNQDIALAAGTVTFDVDDCIWYQSGSGFNDARYAVLYKYTGTPANDRVIAYADLGGNKGNVSGDLTLEMDAAGVFTKTSS
jgi:hypothetical protein